MKLPIRTVCLVLLLIAIAILAFLQESDAQFVVKPDIKEHVRDTTVYCLKGRKVIVYRLEDGDAWIWEENKVSYLGKQYFDRWRKKNKIRYGNN